MEHNEAMTFDDGLTTAQGILLNQESDSAKHLLAYGLRALRNAAFHDTTRDPVMTMLSIGSEKLLKVSLGLFNVATEHAWPSKDVFTKEYRHDLIKMEGLVHNAIRDNMDRATHRKYVEDLLTAVENDPVWPPLLASLNRYGQSGRFYYLDALAEEPQRAPSPEAFWDEVDNVAVNDPELKALFQRTSQDFGLFDEFNRKLNLVAAGSLKQWWELVAMAGKQGVMGERGKGWGHAQSAIGRQVIGD